MLFPPLIAYFMPAAWQWPFAIFPTYWLAQLLWHLQANDPIYAIFLVVALVYQLLLMALLVRQFARVIHR